MKRGASRTGGRGYLATLVRSREGWEGRGSFFSRAPSSRRPVQFDDPLSGRGGAERFVWITARSASPVVPVSR